MRITFVTPAAEMSGGARVIHIYAKAFAERGHQVTVVTKALEFSMTKRVRSFASGRGWSPRVVTGPTFFDPACYDYHVAPPRKPIVASQVPEADVVVATFWSTALWIDQFPISKGRKVHFVQHYEALLGGMPKDQVDAALRLPMPKITISTWLAHMLRGQFDAAHVTLVPNGVDTMQFSASPRGKQPRPTIGLMYNGDPSKDMPTGFAAFAQVKRTFPDAELVMFGKTTPRLKVPIPKGTRYTLQPQQSQIKDLYASCDVWVCSSSSEGFGLPALEAMACRCPVASTRVAGPEDFLIDGVDGLLSPVGDPAALAENILAILSKPEPEWRKMSDAAFANASRRGWNASIDRFEAALRDIVSLPTRDTAAA